MTQTKTAFVETRLNWICWQLREYFQLERTASEIWLDVYNDAGRDEETANAMIAHLANDYEALHDFANTISPNPRSTIVYRDQYVDRPFWVGVSASCLLVGYWIGAWWGSLIL